MKRDIARLAESEHLPLSRFCVGILRLGLGRYFELLDARKAEPLRAKMRDLFPPEAPFPAMPEFVRLKFEATRR